MFLSIGVTETTDVWFPLFLSRLHCETTSFPSSSIVSSCSTDQSHVRNQNDLGVTPETPPGELRPLLWGQHSSGNVFLQFQQTFLNDKRSSFGLKWWGWSTTLWIITTRTFAGLGSVNVLSVRGWPLQVTRRQSRGSAGAFYLLLFLWTTPSAGGGGQAETSIFFHTSSPQSVFEEEEDEEDVVEDEEQRTDEQFGPGHERRSCSSTLISVWRTQNIKNERKTSVLVWKYSFAGNVNKKNNIFIFQAGVCVKTHRL